MPPRLDLTPEQALARLERRREQSRLAMARLRAARRGVSPPALAHGNGLANTPASLHARTNGSAEARSTAFLVPPSLSEKEVSPTDFEQVRCVLEPLRGYAHDERLLARLAATCPAVDLVLEAIGMAEWLNRAGNRKRTCSKAFVSNWVKRAATTPVGRTEPPPRRQEPRSALGRVLEQIATSPVEGPSTWGNR